MYKNQASNLYILRIVFLPQKRYNIVKIRNKKRRKAQQKGKVKMNNYTAKQQKAVKNIENAAIDYIYGLQNGCLDSEKGSQMYNDYYNQLTDLETIIKVVYVEAMSCLYGDGFVSGCEVAKRYIKDIRFCGKEFLMQKVTEYCTKYQKEALQELA